MQKDYDFNTKKLNGLKESMQEDIAALVEAQKRKRFKQRRQPVKEQIRNELLN